jgi:hypothetical protein
MADQAKERPHSPGESADPREARREAPAARHAADAGGALRLNQEAVPLPSVESDPLAEAARHFRERQAQSAGITELPSRTRTLPAGDVARDLMADDGQLPGLALPSTTSSAPVAPPPPPALADTPAPLIANDELRLPSAGESRDAMARASALAAAAPVLTTLDLPSAPSTPLAGETTIGTAKLPPLPAIDPQRRLASGPSSNLRLFAGLSVIIAAFAGSLVWIAMWRADSFSSGVEAMIDVSPEDLVQTAAGGNGGTSLASADTSGTVTATLLVRDTELMLTKLDFDPGPADGVLDDTTRDAIRRYQQVAGLPETGEPSQELLDELREVVAAIGAP